MPLSPVPPIVVMGVQGSGKSTVAGLLAERLGLAFVEGDGLHPARNVELMSAGVPLSDEDRGPWLDRVGAALAAGADGGVVVSCSALKAAYRDRLREAAPGLFVVCPVGSFELIAARVAARSHEFMPAALLRSQFDAFEPLGPGERGLLVDAAEPPGTIVERVVRRLAEAG